MADSPTHNAEGPARVSVWTGGHDVSERAELISVVVRHAFNRVPSATLSFIDGDMPNQCFPLSDAADFQPGAQVEIKAGYGDEETSIFKGIVVRHGLSITGDNDARLVLECRHKAVKMTVGRRNAIYRKKSDTDIAKALIAQHGLTAKVSGATEEHEEVIQHYCSDWDFLLMRAEANACLVVVGDGTVSVAAADVSESPVLTITYGEDLQSFKADLDAQDQFSKVQAQAWDPANQVLLQGNAAPPAALSAQGNLTSDTLAKVLNLGVMGLQSGAALTRETLDGWAKAQQLKSGLSRLRGSMAFQGSALAEVGTIIELKGAGERFNGKVLASAVTHRIEQGNWTTEVDFGRAAPWFAERSDILAPAAAGLVPGIEGLHVGQVIQLDKDDQGAHRIQVGVPTAGIDHVWARLMQFHASQGFGAFFLPEIGDEVVLGWFNNDPAHPVVLGSLYSAKHAPPQTLEASNDIKAIVTRCLAKLEINDKDKVITLTTPGQNVIVLSDKDKSITLNDQNGNKVELGTGGITLDSPKDIKISAKGTITIDAVGALSLSSKADVKIEGMNVNATAKVGAVVKGSATAELSASGQTTVKGGLVMIN